MGRTCSSSRSTNEFAAKRNKGRKYDEGRKVKDEFAAERAKLEAIRDKMVHDMEKKGVNPRYLSEMKMAISRRCKCGRLAQCENARDISHVFCSSCAFVSSCGALGDTTPFNH